MPLMKLLLILLLGYQVVYDFGPGPRGLSYLAWSEYPHSEFPCRADI